MGRGCGGGGMKGGMKGPKGGPKGSPAAGSPPKGATKPRGGKGK